MKLKMKDESRLKEIGLGLALSLVVATPAHSKVSPLSNQLTLLSTQTTNLYNSINNLDRQIYINSVDNISILLDNLPQKGEYQKFPIFTNQISPLTPRLEQKLLTKKHQKKFTEKFSNTFTFVSSTNKESQKIQTLEFSELTTNLESENALALPISDNSLTLLPPISEKSTLITREKLLQKKQEVEQFHSKNTENIDIKPKEINVTLADKNVNKKQQQSQKNFQDLDGLFPNSVVQNRQENKITDFNLSTFKNESNDSEKNVAKQQSQIEEKLNKQASKIFRINQIQQPLTSASALYQPDIVITNFSENIRIAQQIIQVTNIEVNTTAEGLEIVLETLNGEKLQLQSAVDGNTLIADIPNAVLALPDTEEFSTQNPIQGIANITAQTIDGNSIRVTIEGETNLPTVAIVSTDEGLTLSLNPVTDEDIEVVISAARTGRKEEDIPRSITVIGREQIEGQGAVSTTNNLTDLLGRLVPGYGPPNLVERGARAQNLRGRPALILIDGVVQNSNVSGSPVNIIDPSAIERIEVIRGPSALYGSGGSGGIVNIVTREPTGSKLEQQIRVGISDSIGDETFPGNGIGYNSSYSFSGNQGIFDWRLQASLNQINRLYDADGDVIPSNFLDGSRSLNFLTKLGIDISEDEKLAFNYNLYNDRIFSENLSDPAIVSIPGFQKARELRVGKLEYEERPETTNHNLSATYNNDNILWGSKLYTQFFFQQSEITNKFGDNRELLSFLLSGSGIELSPDAPINVQSRLVESKIGTRFQVNTPITRTTNFRWGFDYTNERSDSRELVADPVAFDEDREINIIDSNRISPAYVLNSLGIFTEGNWDVNEKLILNGGARYEKIYANVDGWEDDRLTSVLRQGQPFREYEGGSSDASDVAFNFGVLYKASSAISLFANFSQGFTIPSLSFLTLSEPGGVDFIIDDVLEPEKVDNYEIGVRGNWNSVQFTVTGYYNNSDLGQTLFLDPSAIATEVARTPQRNYGVEATIDWQPANTWGLGGTLTWMEGEGDFPGIDRSWQPLSTLEVQPMKLTFYLENQTLPSWKNRLQLLYVTNRDRAFDDGVDSVRIAGYTTVDFVSTLNTDLGRLEVGIENLLNHQYFPVVAQLRNTPVQEQRRLAAPGRSLSIRYFLDF